MGISGRPRVVAPAAALVTVLVTLGLISIHSRSSASGCAVDALRAGDSVGSGAIAVARPRYLATFDHDGFVFVPRSRRGGAQPLRWQYQLEQVAAGDRVLFDRRAKAPTAPSREGARVEYPRGPGVTERYDLLDAGVEQTFVLDSPVVQDLLIRGRVGGGLRPTGRRDPHAPVVFAGANASGVTYGTVTVVDARGRRTPASVTAQDDRLDIHVDGAWLRAAAYPVRVDPIISEASVIDASTDSTASPALAFDVRRNRYLVVYEHPVSASEATPRLLKGRWLSTAGQAVGPEFEVASGPPGLTDFTQPSVAHNPEPDEYLVVWQSDHDQPDDLTRIRGIRLRADTGASIGATFVVSDTPGLERKAIDPSVTANPLPGKTWRWLVTWSDSRDGSTAANYRIYGRQLSGTVAFQGPAFAIGTTFLPTHVQGSSAAAFNPTIGQYLVAYEHANGVDDAILVTRVNGDTGVAGGTLDATDVYDTSLDDASHPAVAYNAWARAHVVSWVTEESASSWSVSWLSLDNTAAIPLGRLTSQAPWPFVDPAVAPEYGGNWATTYSQREASPATDFDLGFRWLSGASCCGLAGLLTSGHAGTTPVDDDRLSAVHSNPYYGFSLAVWQFAESATNIDLHAARVWGGAYPIVTATSNFDGVGGADQAVVRLGPSGAMTWFVSGNTGAWAVDWGDAGDVPVAGDYDGDGRADVAVWRPGNGAWYVVRSSSGTAFGRVFGSGAHADQPVPGDYDGDGRTDVAVYRPGNPAVFYIVRSSDNVAYAVLWGTWGDVPLTGDYDGDGRTDIAVWRPASPPDAVGAFFIVPSGGGPAYGRAWGQAGDHPVAGDFDGDGKDDLAVFRPATIDACGWYIVRSSTGAATHTAWGALGDIPVPADYDHDGKTDIAVWRPGATGVFYLLRSAGAPVGLAWGSGFDLPIAR